MVYSDTSTNQGILQREEYYCFGEGNYGAITDSTERTQTFTSFNNSALGRIESKILNADTRWEYGDSGYSTLPIGTATLVAGQQDYGLSVSHLKILRVEVMDANGDWQLLTPMDQSDISAEGLVEFNSTNGLPKYYDKIANSLMLYPAPSDTDVTLASGLKIYVQREPNYFSYDDKTAVPGFPSIFHELVPLWGSYEYLKSQQSFDKAGAMKQDALEMEAELEKYYSKRDKDDQPRLTTKIYSFK